MLYKKIGGTDLVDFDETVLSVDSKAFALIARQGFEDMRYFFRESHLEHWDHILKSQKSSNSEKVKMQANLCAAVEAKKKGVPYCQDCGTDVAYVFRGNRVVFSGTVFDSIASGALEARKNNPFRNSVFVPTKIGETNSGDNSPCEVHHFSGESDFEVSGVLANKGGGSASKLWSFSQSPALLQNSEGLEDFLYQKITEIGHSACPPYQMRIVLGGLSHLQNSEYLTRSTVDEFGFLEDEKTKVIRDEVLESKILDRIAQTKMGAQGEGHFFIQPDGIRIFRAPRHAAHFFVGIGVGCSAHRVQGFKIDKTGVYLEQLCEDPEKYVSAKTGFGDFENLTKIDFSEDREMVLEQLRALKAGDLFLGSGKILGARDKAHAQWLHNFMEHQAIPDYLKHFVGVCYVGPADTPAGAIIGSFGPTTASRMDDFASFLGKNNLIPLSIAKGSRSEAFAKNCGKYGGMFAAIQGGPASLLRNFVVSQKVIDFEALGMEAVRVYEIEGMPMQMITDSTGTDYYRGLLKTL